MTASFVLLGMPMAAIGVAWPAVAGDLGRTLGELGLVTMAYGAGYTVATLASGELTRRFTTGPQLVASAVTAATSLAILATTSEWMVFLLAALLLGLAGGMLDAAVNSYVAVHRGARAMGIVHTGFGVGSAVGPLVVTALLAAGASWRLAFAALGAADLLLAVGFLAVIGALDRSNRRHEQRPSARGKRPVVALSVVVFFFYAGVAAGTGAWIFSFLTEARGVAPTVAGVAVAGYWAALTAARVALGVFGHRVRADHALTVSGVATVIMLFTVWVAPVPWLAITALVASGVAHGWVFPLEMVMTARRFGDAYTSWAVGYEIAGANVGVAVLLGGIGLLVTRFGVEAIGPTLVVLAVALLISIEALRVASTGRGRPAV